MSKLFIKCGKFFDGLEEVLRENVNIVVEDDIIQAVVLGSGEAMLAFAKGIQAAAPVDSYVTPLPWDMPGYEDPVVMAAGAFVSGSSIELSADGPMRAPYAIYFQGGLTWFHGKYGILKSVQSLSDAGIAELPRT